MINLTKLARKDNLEYEFLPENLEIEETPPSPTGSLLIWTVIGLLLFALIWSYFGRIDEVATSRGKVVPDGRVKVVQSLDNGIITGIYVDEGEKVTQGQILLDLDATIKQTDADALQKQIDIANLERDMLNMGIEPKTIDVYNISSEIKADLQKSVLAGKNSYDAKESILNLIVEQRINQLDAENSTLLKIQNEKVIAESNKARLQGIVANGGIEQENLAKAEQNLQLLREREKNYKDIVELGAVSEKDLHKLEVNIDILRENEQKLKPLYETGVISEQEWQNAYDALSLALAEYETQKTKASQETASIELNYKNIVDELILAEKECKIQQIRAREEKLTNESNVKNAELSIVSLERDIEIQKERISQAEKALEQAKADLINLAREDDATKATSVAEKDKLINNLESELLKAKKDVEFKSLESPVNGTVHGLSINTIGGVVSPAQPIMTIVPDGTPLIIEAFVLNKDIGFIKIGQEANIKLDTFPFQKYGTIKGEVVSISPDATDDERQGLVYKTKIVLKSTEFSVNKEQVSISPGMAATVEIKTDERRVVDFFLEPIIKYLEESLKVR
ncbi:hypothetical protein FACS1894188_10090 [Clostridia bacterium]|nr:hypothetical protein FACS1894188_10090 [Clostridia bacterium]